MHADRQTDRQIDKQTDWQTDRLTDWQCGVAVYLTDQILKQSYGLVCFTVVRLSSIQKARHRLTRLTQQTGKNSDRRKGGKTDGLKYKKNQGFTVTCNGTWHDFFSDAWYDKTDSDVFQVTKLSLLYGIFFKSDDMKKTEQSKISYNFALKLITNSDMRLSRIVVNYLW